jgi:hypothetical protein
MITNLTSAHPWTAEDLATLERLYPEGGSYAVQRALPHRTIAAIQRRAHSLGIRNRFARNTDESNAMGWSLPAAPELSDALLNYQLRKPCGAVPGTLMGRI